MIWSNQETLQCLVDHGRYNPVYFGWWWLNKQQQVAWVIQVLFYGYYTSYIIYSVSHRQTGRCEAGLVMRKESWNPWLLIYPFRGSMILDLKESSVSRKKKLCNKKSCHVNLTCTQLQQCKGKMKVLDGDRCILVQDAIKLFSLSQKNVANLSKFGSI
jgi:hypothetical protein